MIDGCADCDICRFLMEESCILFSELYRLYDLEKESGRRVSDKDLRRLVEHCTFCGLCPCPNIRNDLIRAKTGYIQREGMNLRRRLLSDLQSMGRLCGIFPRFINAGLRMEFFRKLAAKSADVHPQRHLPEFPEQTFFEWATDRGLQLRKGRDPKVAYFAGCTAGYLYPQVACAAVSVFEHSGISVYVPPQRCCGMPTMLEGDEQSTISRIRFNLDKLLEASEAGYDIVCSCPTCGYLMRVLLKEGACYSEDYQRSLNAGDDEIKIPSKYAENGGHTSLNKAIYHKILKDDGYFANLDPLKRIALADNVYDMGEYLVRRHNTNQLNTDFGNVTGRMVYYVPCHQREQQTGRPYEEILSRIPGLTLKIIGGALDCCGMGGSLGFKESFYEKSVELGRPLFRKIEAVKPEAIITDCLSCRLQFEHMLPYEVFHPLEVLSRSYKSAG